MLKVDNFNSCYEYFYVFGNFLHLYIVNYKKTILYSQVAFQMDQLVMLVYQHKGYPKITKNSLQMAKLSIAARSQAVLPSVQLWL